MRLLGYRGATHLVVKMNTIQFFTRKPAVLSITLLILMLFFFGWHAANISSLDLASSMHSSTDPNVFQGAIRNSTLGVSMNQDMIPSSLDRNIIADICGLQSLGTSSWSACPRVQIAEME